MASAKRQPGLTPLWVRSEARQPTELSITPLHSHPKAVSRTMYLHVPIRPEGPVRRMASAPLADCF